VLNCSPSGVQGQRVETLPQFLKAPAGLTCRRGGLPLAPAGLARCQVGL
jgi:hypothetical protein